MSGAALNDGTRGMMADVAKWRDDITGINVTGGSGAAYTLSSNQVITANTDGFTVQFTPGATNTGAVTLSVDGQTAKPLRFLTGIDLPAGVLISGSLYQASYRSASSEWLLRSFDASIYSIPIGGGIDFWGAAAPNPSFALAQGQAISRTTYAFLFGLFGTTYGVGDGSTTFNIPDKVGRVSAMVDGGGARISTATMNRTTLGGTGGLETHALTIAEMPVHGHANSLTDPGHKHTPNLGLAHNTGQGVTVGNATAGQGALAGGDTDTATTGITITNANAGSGSAHGIMQPTIVCNYIIRVI